MPLSSSSLLLLRNVIDSFVAGAAVGNVRVAVVAAAAVVVVTAVVVFEGVALGGVVVHFAAAVIADLEGAFLDDF